MCVYFNGGTLTISGSAKISGNNASQNGGGVYVYSGTFTMQNGAIRGNPAHTNGGGIYINSRGTFIKNDGTISGNMPNDVYPNNP